MNLKKCSIKIIIAYSLFLFNSNASTLNFSAFINPGTCDVSVDQAIISFGQLYQKELKPNELLKTKIFKVNISNCTGASSMLKPTIQINGDGNYRDGKWLFRSSGSTSNIGVILYQSPSTPKYSDPEIKNGDNIDIGKNGEVAKNQDILFYAGLTCGGSNDCIYSNAQIGTMTATIIFDLMFR